MLSLGMALMRDPEILLLDEPVAGVNPTLANKIFDILINCRDNFNKTFFIIEHNMDVVLDFSDLIKWHSNSSSIATIASFSRDIHIDLGVLKFDDDENLTGYIEKPTYNFKVSMGIYIFEPKVLEYIPYNRYLDFPDLVLKLIESGEIVKHYSFDGYWQDLGRREDYEKAVRDFEDLQPRILGENRSND